MPLTSPGARIPATLTPTLGVVSTKREQVFIVLGRGRLTVTNNGGVDDESQEGHLVCSSVVLQQSSGVVIADGSIGRTLSDSGANSSREGKSLEKHVCGDISKRDGNAESICLIGSIKKQNVDG